MKIGKGYLIVILLLMLVLPFASVLADYYVFHATYGLMVLIGKWFTFWGIGVRLAVAGLKQIAQPAFTAKDIFHIESKESHVIVRELGFANMCLGLGGVISLFIPEWRMAAAFAGGLYMGIAGVNHIIKKPSSSNEVVAMISDIYAMLITAIYLAGSYL